MERFNLVKILLVSLLLLGAGVCYSAPTPVGKTHVAAAYVQCAAGRWGKKCPPGQAFQNASLAFVDMNSGPDTGLGDGLGSGMIVTVWGYHLGSTQGTSTIEYCDSLAVCRTGHIYYWKNADGALPGGPANLYESHGMQEIAFSIPDSAPGAGTIKVTKDSIVANTLDFTVRTGNIYYVAPGGSNAADCSWATPCEFIDGGRAAPGHIGSMGNGVLVAGETVYSKGVVEPGQSGGGTTSGMFIRGVVGTEAMPVAFMAYPNTRPTVSSPNQGFQGYLSDHLSMSKFSIEVGYANPLDSPNAGAPLTSNWHIFTAKGRYAGNLMTQISGTCFTGWNGAFSSGGESAHKAKIFGNHISELGCDNSSRYAHTLYMSVRSESSVVEAWDIGWNYLDSNNVYLGIHNYDETYSGDCGTVTGTLKIHDNVVVNQRGTAITVNARDLDAPINTCWAIDMEIYNNYLENVGIGVGAEDGVATPVAISIGSGIDSTSVKIQNNTINGFGATTSHAAQQGYALVTSFSIGTPTVTISNNTFIQNEVFANQNWLASSGGETLVTNYNSFWNVELETSNTPPAWTNNVETDPKVTVSNNKLVVLNGSPLINSGNAAFSVRDIYGALRTTTIGVSEF